MVGARAATESRCNVSIWRQLGRMVGGRAADAQPIEARGGNATSEGPTAQCVRCGCHMPAGEAWEGDQGVARCVGTGGVGTGGGVAAAAVSVAFTDALLVLRKWFKALQKLPRWAHPALGGLVTGGLAVLEYNCDKPAGQREIWAAEAMGPGRHNVNRGARDRFRRALATAWLAHTKPSPPWGEWKS